MVFMGSEHGNRNIGVPHRRSRKIVNGGGRHMGGGADRTVMVGHVVQSVMMVGESRIGGQKQQNYGKCQRKFLIKNFADHGINYNEQPCFVNALMRRSWNMETMTTRCRETSVLSFPFISPNEHPKEGYI
jgi:hypothetical protein